MYWHGTRPDVAVRIAHGEYVIRPGPRRETKGMTPEAVDKVCASEHPGTAACYALAPLVQGEMVLIHAATGGVGLTAVQLAQRVGAIVFATRAAPRRWCA